MNLSLLLLSAAYGKVAPIHIDVNDNILNRLLKAAVKHQASDLHLTSDTNPRLRIDGELKELRFADNIFNADKVNNIILESVPETSQRVLETEYEIDYVYILEVENDGQKEFYRFRVNAYRSQGNYHAVFRLISNTILSLSDLNIPPAVGKLTDYNSGLILVAGATGSGKSTTLAALINKINKTKSWVIITIEDPVEFIHKGVASIITQREVGVDTKSFPKALRSALRQDPNAIVIGEIRDKETAEIALQAAQTGHLVLATLHASDCSDAINRYINLFPDNEKGTATLMLAETLKGVVSQRLMDGIDKRLPAVEILLNEVRVTEIIKGKDKSTYVEAMTAASARGMQTFEDSLVELVLEGKVSPAEAKTHATNEHSLTLKLRSQGIQ